MALMPNFITRKREKRAKEIQQHLRELKLLGIKMLREKQGLYRDALTRLGDSILKVKTRQETDANDKLEQMLVLLYKMQHTMQLQYDSLTEELESAERWFALEDACCTACDAMQNIDGATIDAALKILDEKYRKQIDTWFPENEPKT